MLNANKATGGGVPYDPIEAGTYKARVVQVVDLGLQAQRPYQGKERPPSQEVLLTYELVDEFLVDENGEAMLDKPRWISENFAFKNLGSEKAKSTIRYRSLDPNMEHEGDYTALLGTPCYVTVVQNPGKGANAGRIYNNVAAVTPPRAKELKTFPPLVNVGVVFDLSEPNLDIFNKLPEWIQNKIKTNLEYNGSTLQWMLERTPVKQEAEQEKAPF